MRYPITVPTLLVLAGSALAEDSLASKFDVHGFFTQGYTKSTGNTYLADDSKTGSWDLNSVALNVGCQITDRFRIAAQFYGENLWEEGEVQDQTFAREKVQLDLLFAQYSVRDWLGVRVGRIKQPFGLYNETQDFDHTRVAAILPQSVYDVRAREYHFAVNGIGLYGSIQAGKAGSFDYQVFYGNQQIPSDGTVAKQYQSPDVGLNSITLDRVAGAQLFWNAPSGKLEGLKLGFSYRHSKNLVAEAYLPNNVPFGPPPSPTVLAGPLTVKSDRVQEYCASVEYVRGNFTFQGEYLRTRNRQSYSPLQLQVPVPFPPFSVVTPYELGTARIDNEGFYFMPSYRVLPALEIGGYASFYHQDFQERKTERSNDYQYDYALTAKYDLFDWWTIKFEGHRVDGSGLLNVPDKQTAYFGGNDTGVKSWWYVVAKTTFSF